MKLSDLERFSIESTLHPSGRMSVSLFVLGDERVNGGNQRSLSMINVTDTGKNETEATQSGIKKALGVLEKLQPLADIIRVGVLDLKGDKKDGFTCTVQLGLFDRDSVEKGADLVRKKTLGFGSGSTADLAEKNALKSALDSIGEKV